MPDGSSRDTPNAVVASAILLLSAMTVMANATISPSLPGLREHFSDVPGIDTLAGLILTLPALAVVLTAGFVGWLADRVDRQKLLLAAGSLYAAGGTSGLWVDGLTGLLAGRVILGFGVAGTMVLATTWAADLWQGDARTRFLGRQGAATSVGGMIVVLIGGALASLHWRGAFAAYLIVVPVTLLGLFALAPHSDRHNRVRQLASVRNPSPDPFPWSAFAFVGTLGFWLMAIFYAIPTRLPFLLAEVDVRSPPVLSAVISLVTAAALPGAIAYARISEKMSATNIFASSLALMGLGMLILSSAQNLFFMSFGVAVVGLGLGPNIPGYTSYLMAVVPVSSRGRASGLLTTALFAGQFASPLVSAPLVAAFGLRATFMSLAFVQFGLACLLAGKAVRERALRKRHSTGSRCESTSGPDVDA